MSFVTATRASGLFASAALVAVASAQSVYFDFGSTTQGWITYNISLSGGHLTNPAPGSALAFDATLGQPAGSLRVTDLAGETWIGNPAGVSGDHSDLYGTQVSYDVLYRTRDEADYLAIALAGATITLYQAHTRPTLNTWLHWSYPLTPGAWHVNSATGAIATEQDIRAVLADLRGLYIHTEWKTGSDDTSVDNILIGCTGVTPANSPTICPGGTATLAINASGPGPFTYRWQVQSTHTAQWMNLSDGPLFVNSTLVATLANAATPQISWTDRIGNWSDWLGIRCVVTSDCETTASPRSTISICRSDFNCDAVVDLFDYLDFVDAFSTLAPSSDFNQDGVIDFFDYLDFVQAFSSGC